MSSAHRYVWTRADGSTGRGWRAAWVGADGRKRFRRGFDRKTDAEAYAADREAEARHGVTLEGERPSGKTTVEAWAKTWLAAQEVRPSTAEAYRYAVKRIDATLGGRSLGSLRPSELRAWRKGLHTRYAPSTADQTASILAMILRAAVHDDLLPRSPMPPARSGSTSTARIVDPNELLTLEQVQAWSAAMPVHARAMPLVAAMTGLRQGELLGLQASRVDFLRRELRVDPLDGQLLTPAGSGRPTYGPPKTAAAARTVPLVDLAGQVLAHHLEQYPTVPGEPVFLGARGQRWRRQTFRDCWVKARNDAKLPPWAHWHSLRDFYASSLIRTNTDLRTVMTLMGHASSEETLRTYARIWPDSQDRVRQVLDSLWTTAGSHDVATGEEPAGQRR